MNRQSKLIAWLSSRTGLIVTASLVILGFFLFTEHRAHVLGAWPYILLVLFLVLHLFLHSKHGGHSAKNTKNEDNNNSSSGDKT